jgi:hypothetical protein
MGKKRHKSGIWSSRRTWLMNILSTLLILVLGKGLDWLQTSPIPNPRDTRITPNTGSLRIGSPVTSGSATLAVEWRAASHTSSNSAANSVGVRTPTDSGGAIIRMR